VGVAEEAELLEGGHLVADRGAGDPEPRVLRDRFGPIPREVKELLDGVRLRRLAKQLGFEKLQLRRSIMKCYTIEDPESSYYDSETFAKLLGYITAHPQRCSMRQMEKSMLIQIKEVRTMHEAMGVMKKMIGEN
jgi:transcription-repair coupling factor (superfamily II helicase)